MMPALAVIRIRGRRGRHTVWLPLIFVWLLLLPLALVALPLLLAYCVIGRVSVARAAGTAAEVLGGLKGARIHVEGGAHSVSLEIA